MPICAAATAKKFLNPWVGTFVPTDADPDPVQFYARLRVGKTKRTCHTIWSVDLAGGNAAQLAADAIGKAREAGARMQSWLEVVEKNGSLIKDTLALGTSDDQPGDEEEDEMASPGAMLGVAIRAVTDTNAMLAGRLNSQEQRYHELLVQHIQTSAQAAGALTLLDWQERHPQNSDDDGFSKALELLAPSLGPVLAAAFAGRAGAAAPPPTPATSPETGDQKADRLLAEINDMADNQPQLLRSRKLQLMGLGGKLAQLLDLSQEAM